MEQDSTVLVPVPTWLLPEVYQFLAERMARGPEAAGGHRLAEPTHVYESRRLSPPSESGGRRNFSAAELGLLKRTLEPRSAARVMLDLCAESPDTPLAYETLVAASLGDNHQVRGQLGALTKILKKLFGSDEWPVTIHYGNQGQATYIMTEATARLWKTLR